MKKKWLALCGIILFFLSVFLMVWIEKPVILQTFTDTVKTTVNNRLNGTFSFDTMDVSLSGSVILTKPVITDIHGTDVISGDSLSVQVNLRHILDILHGGDAMSALDTIVVERPVVHAVQENDDTWNVASLIKKSGNSTDVGYRGRVRLHDGTIFTSFKDGTQLTGEDCNIYLDFSDYPAIKADGEASVDQEKLTVSGQYRSMRDYNVTINSDAVNVKYAVPFIPANAAISLHDGVVKNIKAHVSQSHKGFFLSGQADLSDGAATIQGYDVTDVKGHVNMTSDEITLKDTEGLVNGQKLHVDGAIKVNGDTPVFDLQVQAPSVDLDALPLTLPVSGIIGWQGSVWGTADDISAKGTVTVSTLEYDGLSVSDGHADVMYQNHVGRVDALEADVAGGHISGSGIYYVDTGDFSASAKMKDIRLDAIPQVPAALLGTISADVAVSGNSNDRKNISGQGHVSATDLSYNGIEADQAACDVSYADGIASIRNLTASVANGSIQASGTFDVNTNTPDITFTASDIPLDLFESWLAVPMEGTVSAAGHIWGQEPQWNVAFSAQSGSIQHMPFDSVDGSLNGIAGHINIPSIAWRFVDGRHILRGSADWDSRTVNLQMDTEHMRIERVLPVLGKENMDLTGWADNTITISGPLDDLSATGHFRLSEGSYSGYLYKDISADYRLDHNVLFISNGAISAYDATIGVHGSVGENLDLTIEGNQLDISRIMIHQNSLPRSGMMHLKAHIGGSLQNPTAGGSLTAEHLVINQMPVEDVHGDFAYYDGIIRLSDLHFNQNNGLYDGNVMYNTGNDRVIIRGSVQNGDLAGLLNLSNIPLQKVAGRLDGDISVDGTGKNPKAAFTGKLTQAYLDGQAVEPTDIDVRFDDGVFKINKLSLTMGDAVLAAQGSYALHGPVDMQVAAHQFPSRILLDILGQTDIDVDTDIDFAAQLSGNSDNPDANVSLQLTGGAVNGVSITNAYALFNVADGLIHLNQFYVEKDPYKASATGTIPVNALKNGRTAESMDVTLQLDHAGLDILTFLTPAVKTAQGGIEGSLKLSGTLQDPRLNGALSVKDGSIQFKDVKYPLSHISGAVKFTGTAMSMDINAQMDKQGAKKPGTADIQGKASWQGWKLTDYDVVADADHLNIESDYFTGPLNGHIKLTPGAVYPKLSGIVEISNATIDVPLSFTSSAGSMPLELDFTVSLGDKVRLYNSALYDMLINGSVNFKGTVDQPRPAGRFEALRGRVHYLDTNFVLTKAKADFSIQNSFLPVISAEAHTRVGQYMVLLTLRGPVEQMDMMLRSDPPLTKQQIISLITLRSGGKQSSSINGEDVNTLIGTGIRMTLNSLGITHELEKALSLDMLTVTTGSLDFNDKNTDINRNYYNIEMGKYLFNDFIVTAAFGLNHDDNRFGVQYSLGNRFNVNAWKSEGDTFIGGSYKYNFF